MVNGPASGGEFPLGKEYWENQDENKGYEYDPNKNVPKKTIKVPVGQTQQGEAIKKIEQKFSAKEIAKLIKKFKLEQKKMEMAHFERIELTEKPMNDLRVQKSAAKVLEKLMALIPEEEHANLTSEKAIFDYLLAHPELRQKMGVGEEQDAEQPAEEPAEEKPVAEKTTEETPEAPLPQEENG